MTFFSLKMCFSLGCVSDEENLGANTHDSEKDFLLIENMNFLRRAISSPLFLLFTFSFAAARGFNQLRRALPFSPVQGCESV